MIHFTEKNNPNEDVCYLLNLDNHSDLYLLDCGEAPSLTIQECIKVKVLFISHTHFDHFIFFDSFMRHQLGTGKKIIIIGPPGIAKNIEGKMAGFEWNLIEADSFSFEVRELIAPNQIKYYRLNPPEWKLVFEKECTDSIIYSEKRFNVKATFLDHKTVSVAYLFEEVSKTKVKPLPFKPGPWVGQIKNAFEKKLPETIVKIEDKEVKAGKYFDLFYEQKGHRLAYVMDHLGSPENHQLLLDFCPEVDQLIIETYYRNIDQDFANKNHHSTAYLSGTIARKLKARSVAFVHHSRRYGEEIEDLLEEANAAFEDRSPNYQKKPTPRF